MKYSPATLLKKEWHKKEVKKPDRSVLVMKSNRTVLFEKIRLI